MVLTQYMFRKQGIALVHVQKILVFVVHVSDILLPWKPKHGNTMVLDSSTLELLALCVQFKLYTLWECSQIFSKSVFLPVSFCCFLSNAVLCNSQYNVSPYKITVLCLIWTPVWFAICIKAACSKSIALIAIDDIVCMIFANSLTCNNALK